jgi:hypothetical protein
MKRLPEPLYLTANLAVSFVAAAVVWLWVAAGQKVFRHLEVGGTFITWGQVASWSNQADDINDLNHPDNGTWVKEGWESHKKAIGFPAYKYDYKSEPVCPESCLISDVGVSGGKQYWWHTNMVKFSVKAEETPVSNLDNQNNVINPLLITTTNWVNKKYTYVLDEKNL